MHVKCNMHMGPRPQIAIKIIIIKEDNIIDRFPDLNTIAMDGLPTMCNNITPFIGQDHDVYLATQHQFDIEPFPISSKDEKPEIHILEERKKMFENPAVCSTTANDNVLSKAQKRKIHLVNKLKHTAKRTLDYIDLSPDNINNIQDPTKGRRM